MFKLEPNPTFITAVLIDIPGQNARARIDVEFRHLRREALGKYFEGLAGKTDVEALTDVVVGWSGVDQPYSAESLAALLNNYPLAAVGLFEAFRREMIGASSAPAKTV